MNGQTGTKYCQAGVTQEIKVISGLKNRYNLKHPIKDVPVIV